MVRTVSDPITTSTAQITAALALGRNTEEIPEDSRYIQPSFHADNNGSRIARTRSEYVVIEVSLSSNRATVVYRRLTKIPADKSVPKNGSAVFLCRNDWITMIGILVCVAEISCGAEVSV